jgi:hypothetical protein
MAFRGPGVEACTPRAAEGCVGVGLSLLFFTLALSYPARPIAVNPKFEARNPKQIQNPKRKIQNKKNPLAPNFQEPAKCPVLRLLF